MVVIGMHLCSSGTPCYPASWPATDVSNTLRMGTQMLPGRYVDTV